MPRLSPLTVRKEWYCCFCSKTNVWTRSKRRRCETNISSVLQGKYKQAVSTKAHTVHRAKETELRELREEVKKLKKEGRKEGRKTSVPFEEAGEDGRFEENGTKEVG